MYDGPATASTQAPRGLGRLNSSPEDESPSRIRNLIGECEQVIPELHGLINRVEKRLDTALTPVPPNVSEADKTSKAEGPSSDVSHRLAELHRALIYACQRLSALNYRIEI